MDKEDLKDFKLIRCNGFIRIILKPLQPISAYIGNGAVGVHERSELSNLQQIVRSFFERVNWGVGVRA